MMQKLKVQPAFICLTFFLLSLAAFSFAQGGWSKRANYGGAGRVEAVSFSIGAKGYLGTGQQPFPATYEDFWEWDQITNAWTQKSDFGGGPIAAAVGFSIGTKGYIGTGNTGIPDFWEWDQTTNAWIQKANFPGGARSYAVGFSIGLRGFIGTGSNTTGTYNDFWEWNQATNVWTQRANFGGTARSRAVGFSIGTKGYIGTGSDVDSSRSDFWEWEGDTTSPSYNTWTQKANFGGGVRIHAVGFSIGNKGYVGTGNTYSANFGFNDFWEWNQTTNTWSQLANYGGGGVIYATGFSIANSGYIGTGSYGPGGNQDFWEYCDTCAMNIDESSNAINVSIYPNPTEGTINISSGSNINSVEIYSTLGGIVYSNSEMTTAINLSRHQAGIYFVRVKMESGILTKKIIVKR